MVSKLAHIGIAIKDLDDAAKIFSILLDRNPDAIEDIADQKVKAVNFDVEGGRLELLAGTATDSPISKFIEKKGAGIHHISLEVDDIEAEIKRLEAAGIQMIDKTPRRGAEGALIAFIHPKSTAGILIELNQKK